MKRRKQHESRRSRICLSAYEEAELPAGTCQVCRAQLPAELHFTAVLSSYCRVMNYQQVTLGGGVSQHVPSSSHDITGATCVIVYHSALPN